MVISFGRFRLNIARCELRRDQTLVRLGSRAVDILWYSPQLAASRQQRRADGAGMGRGRRRGAQHPGPHLGAAQSVRGRW